MKEPKNSNRFAKLVASWLLKDLQLNTNTASSSHMYEPAIPVEIKEIKSAK